MTIYDLTLLFLGVLIISLCFLRRDITRPKVMILCLLSLAVFLALYFSVHHHYRKTCVVLTGHSIADVKALILSWGIAAPLMSIFLMTMQAVIAPLPSFLITAANGLIFGSFWGTVISWVGAMSGASVTFIMSRLFYEYYAKRVFSQKKGIEYLGRLSSRYGFRVVLTARLLPFVSFDFISYAAGLSSMQMRPFMLATGIGMIPATVVYNVVGSEMVNLNAYSNELFTFSLLVVAALVLIWTIQAVYRRKQKALQKRL